MPPIRTTLAATLVGAAVTAVLAGSAGSAASALPKFTPVASLQDLMLLQVDVAADALWASVATIETTAGTEVREPKTPVEWVALRGHALALAETVNLLLIDGRPVAGASGVVADEDAPGNLNAAQITRALETNRVGFLESAHTLQAAARAALAAIDAKNPAALGAAGEKIQQACDGCHQQFWYPATPPAPAR